MSISTDNNNNKIMENSIEPEEDLIKFQNSLDESINLAKDLVNSWLPKNLDSSWDLNSNSSNSNSNSFDVTRFSAKARPPRLGLGADVGKYHIQQAEDTKLRNKLLSNGSKKRLREEEELSIKKSSTVGGGGGKDSGSESEEEEDSRSNSFKKINGTSNSSLIPNGKKSIKNNNNNNNNNSSSSSSTLFNPATPIKNSPSSIQPTPPSQQLKKTIAPISFYASVIPPSSIASTSSSTHLNGTTSTLTKNQRKKERDKAKLRETKKLRLEESRAADNLELKSNGRVFETEEEEEQSRDSSISPTPPSPRLKDHLKKRLVKPPFAPSDSSSGTEEIFSKPSSLKPVVKVKEVVEKENGSDDDGEEETVKDAHMNGDGEKKSKKRRRNKKKKSTEEGGESKSLLNLEARPSAVESSP